MNEATTRSDREGGITRRRRARGGGTGGEGVGGEVGVTRHAGRTARLFGLRCFSRIVERRLIRTYSLGRTRSIKYVARYTCSSRSIYRATGCTKENDRVPRVTMNGSRIILVDRLVCSLLELVSFVLSRVTVQIARPVGRAHE